MKVCTPLLCALVALPLATRAEPPPPGEPEPPPGGPLVVLETSVGDITMELHTPEAPETVANFLRYVKDGHYDGTIFHRLVDDALIKGGSHDAKLNKKSTRSMITNEADNGIPHDRGTIAMARGGNPHSATAEFFINAKKNHHLNHKSRSRAGWGYTVFGWVVEGMDVVEKILSVDKGPKAGFPDVPLTPVVIKAAKRVR